MLRRPRALELFVIFLFLQPILRMLFISIDAEYSLLLVLKKVLALDIKEWIDFWLIFPLLGFSLLYIRKYTIYFFIALQIYIFYFHSTYENYTWPYLSEGLPLGVLGLLLINFFFFIYILTPGLRKVFFKKNIYFWRSANRYLLNQISDFKFKGTTSIGEINNISESGAKLTLDCDLDLEDRVKFRVKVLLFNLSLCGEVVRKSGDADYAVSFIFSNIIQKFFIKSAFLYVELVQGLEKSR